MEKMILFEKRMETIEKLKEEIYKSCNVSIEPIDNVAPATERVDHNEIGRGNTLS
jgi:hypothetical protein